LLGEVVSVSVCPGLCNAQWRTAEAAKVPHDFVARQGSPIWCEPCSRSIETALRALPQDVALLRVESENGTAPQRERVSGTKPRPIHPRESFTFLAEDIYLTVTGWEDDVREQRRFSPRKARGTQARQTQDAVRFLLSHVHWLMQDHPSTEAVVEFGREVTLLHRRVQKAIKDDDLPLQRCEGVRCPKCMMKTLVREQHYDKSLTGYILCQGCENLMTKEQYEAHVKREAKGAKKLVRRA
jgi:hypothetical protein